MHEVLVIAGEKSAEEHFLALYEDIQKGKEGFSFYGVGGSEMKRVGVECLYDLSSFSSMGFTEPLRKLPYYFQAMKVLLSEVHRRNSKYAILIDFQEFNLKLAQKLSEAGVKVLYYVAPQAWAWREGRCAKLSLYTHRLYTILPFEKEWFEQRGVKNIVDCQHPVFKKFDKLKPDFEIVQENRASKKTVLFLPGSRNSEVSKLLPTYFEVFKKLKSTYDHYQFSIVLSSSISLDMNHSELNEFDHVYTDKEIDLALSRASFCISSSGTVNLNCAFYRIPTIVCYDANRLNHFIAREIIGYKGYASLVNIMSGKEIFPELLQGKCNIKNLFYTAVSLLDNEKRQAEIIDDLKQLYLKFSRGESSPGIKIREVIENAE